MCLFPNTETMEQGKTVTVRFFDWSFLAIRKLESGFKSSYFICILMKVGCKKTDDGLRCLPIKEKRQAWNLRPKWEYTNW